MLIVKARPLRVLDLTLSRSRSDQSSEKFSAISNILGEEDKKLFLEFNATGAATILEGDSGGPIYYEIINDDGTVNPALAGIITGFQRWCHLPIENEASCTIADCGLRVEAFHDDAFATQKRINEGTQ